MLTKTFHKTYLHSFEGIVSDVSAGEWQNKLSLKASMKLQSQKTPVTSFIVRRETCRSIIIHVHNSDGKINKGEWKTYKSLIIPIK